MNTTNQSAILQSTLTHSPCLNSPAIEPWPTPVQGALLLDELVTLITRFAVLPKWAPETLALWVVHSYAFDLRNVSTYIGLESPEKRCGKTTVLAVLSELVHRPVVAANISPPALFRVIEETRPTLLIDEADTLLQGNDELRGILNSGYSRKTAFVVRVASNHNRPRTTDYRPGTTDHGPSTPDPRPLIASNSDEAGSIRDTRHLTPDTSMPDTPHPARTPNPFGADTRLTLARFSCWCPKAMAAIGRLPETLADRCIIIHMRRKTQEEQCERLRDLDGSDFRRRCLRFVQDNAQVIAAARPEIPSSLNDRAADIWEPLLTIADTAGSDWPQRVRQAAVALGSFTRESSPTTALLLELLLPCFESKYDRIFSRTLAAHLNASLDKPWAEAVNGKPITELWLSRKLRPYGLRPRPIRIGHMQGRGYIKQEMVELLRRYIPRSAVEELLAEHQSSKDPISP